MSVAAVTVVTLTLGQSKGFAVNTKDMSLQLILCLNNFHHLSKNLWHMFLDM